MGRIHGEPSASVSNVFRFYTDTSRKAFLDAMFLMMMWLLTFVTGFTGLALIALSSTRLWQLFKPFNSPQELLDKAVIQRTEKNAVLNARPQTLPADYNALTAPGIHLEAEYVRSLDPEDKKARTVTADDAFWTQDIDVIKQWVLENRYEPGADWKVILSGSLTLNDLIILAEMPELHHHWNEYFVSSAYIRVGDIKLQAEQSHSQDIIDEMMPIIRSAEASENQRVATWASRAVAYLNDQPGSASLARYFQWTPKAI